MALGRLPPTVYTSGPWERCLSHDLAHRTSHVEEEEEDLFVFNDGRLRLSQGASLKPDESEGFSPRRRRIYSY